jgi:hypothetical protein
MVQTASSKDVRIFQLNAENIIRLPSNSIIPDPFLLPLVRCRQRSKGKLFLTLKKP